MPIFYSLSKSLLIPTLSRKGRGSWRPLLRGPLSPPWEGDRVRELSKPLAFLAKTLVFALLLASLAVPASAVDPQEQLNDPGLEARARDISAGLRCLVCQNQSIDDSDAPLARDLRVLVRERLTSGDSDPQVVDFLVARYGEFVLLKPRFAWHNVVLWLTPAAALVAGAIAMFAAIRRRREVPLAAAPLSPDEERRLAEVIDRAP